MTPTDARPVAALDDYLAAFESAYARDGAADPADFLPPPADPLYPVVLRELLRVDLEFAWDRGEERRVETYRDRFPDLWADPDGLRAVAAEEFRLRQAAGDAPTPGEYRRRLGVEVLDTDHDGPLTYSHTPLDDQSGGGGATRPLPPAPSPTGRGGGSPEPAARSPLSASGRGIGGGVGAPAYRMPEAGDRVVGFEVEGELGRGAFGRVYLAREPGLAGRPVVLKVSSRLPGEGQTLARLQHTNIVPIYSVHRHGAFHVLCMPYLGATTVADLLAAFRGPGGRPASGRGVISTLAERAQRTTADGADPTPAAPRPAAGLSRANLDRLERLSYPDTVLWLGVQLADGLAHAHERGVLHRDLKPANILLADDGRPLLLDFNLAADAGDAELPVGGTLRYMPPEALADLAAGCGHADPRADVYGLGLILYELLTDRFPYPDPPAGTPTEVVERMRADRLGPPPHASTVRPDVSPATAAILAACLDPDPARRYPSAAALRDDLQRQLDSRPLAFAREPSARERARKWARRHPRLASGSTVATVAGVVLLLVAGLAVAAWEYAGRVGAVNHLNALRAAAGSIQARTFDPEPPAALCREAVEQAAAALAPYRAEDDPDWPNGPLLARLPEAERDTARRDVAVVLRDYSHALAGLARHDPDRRAELLGMADRAKERAAAVEAGPDAADRIRDALKGGRHREAIDLLRPLAEAGDPSYAVFAQLGFCHLRLGEPAEAVRWLDGAAALAPGATPGLLYRGAALLDAGRPKDALADFDRVLAKHPDEPEGFLNRAVARVGANDPAGAIADLDRLEKRGAPFARLYFVREHARRLAGDAAGAEADFRAGLAKEPADARSWVARGEAKLRLVPPDAAGALADFEAGVKLDPGLIVAWEQVAAVLSEHLGRPDDAVVALGRVLELSARHLGARAGRAVLHARAGRTAEARADARACLDRDPPALVHYQLACAYLLTAAGDADRAQALGLLRTCLRKDPTWARGMPADPDLKAVHADPAFRTLVDAAGVLAK